MEEVEDLAGFLKQYDQYDLEEKYKSFLHRIAAKTIEEYLYISIRGMNVEDIRLSKLEVDNLSNSHRDKYLTRRKNILDNFAIKEEDFAMLKEMVDKMDNKTTPHLDYAIKNVLEYATLCKQLKYTYLEAYRDLCGFDHPVTRNDFYVGKKGSIQKLDYKQAIKRLQDILADNYALDGVSFSVVDDPEGVSKVTPNPVQTQSSIDFVLSESSNVTIDVIDLLGNVRYSICNQQFGIGINTVSWQPNETTQNLSMYVRMVNSSGVYQYPVIQTQ